MACIGQYVWKYNLVRNTVRCLSYPIDDPQFLSAVDSALDMIDELEVNFETVRKVVQVESMRQLGDHEFSLSSDIERCATLDPTRFSEWRESLQKGHKEVAERIAKNVRFEARFINIVAHGMLLCVALVTWICWAPKTN